MYCLGLRNRRSIERKNRNVQDCKNVISFLLTLAKIISRLFGFVAQLKADI